MTQTKRDPVYRRVFGQRLQALVETHLKVSWRDLALRLGYGNDSVLRQARDGAACMSAEKLAALADLTFGPNDARVSLDWLLTGNGTPLWDGPAPSPALTGVAARVQLASVDVQRTIAAYLDVQLAGAMPTQRKSGRYGIRTS